MKSPDVQSLPDNRNIEIDRVGVKNVRYPIVVEDRAQKMQHTVAMLDMHVNLPHQHRGTHMSRFIEVLNSFHETDIVGHLPQFLQGIKDALHADTAYTLIKFPYFMRRTAPVSGSVGLLAYDCMFEAALEDNFNLIIGVKVPVTTLCPCSKEISERGAHNQRSIVQLEVRYNSFVWLEELIELVESVASCPVYPLLKRPDEKYVTEHAYDHPMFVEDMVRDITLKLQSDNRIDYFVVESVNAESIHAHDAYARIERGNRYAQNL